jgi:hypothetical protein
VIFMAQVPVNVLFQGFRTVHHFGVLILSDLLHDLNDQNVDVHTPGIF